MSSGIVCTKANRARQDIGNIKTQLELYQSFMGRLPSTADSFQALIAPPASLHPPAQWRQLLTDIPIDPWGQLYQYRYPATKSHRDPYDLFSCGPDKLPDTADDIGNW